MSQYISDTTLLFQTQADAAIETGTLPLLLLSRNSVELATEKCI
jgi:hypothetical protein